MKCAGLPQGKVYDVSPGKSLRKALFSKGQGSLQCGPFLKGQEIAPRFPLLPALVTPYLKR